MQNIPRAILPYVSIHHDTVKNIWYLFFKVLDCAHVVWTVFVGESICQGETALFVSRVTMLFRSWVIVLAHPNGDHTVDSNPLCQDTFYMW